MRIAKEGLCKGKEIDCKTSYVKGGRMSQKGIRLFLAHWIISVDKNLKENILVHLFSS